MKPFSLDLKAKEAKPEGNQRDAHGSKIPALDGLRFIAAFCILFSHACAWLANFPNNDFIVHTGDYFTTYGMSLFFVLSGFVIHYNYKKLFQTMRLRWAVAEFASARFARLYPLFICAFAVGIAVDGMLQWPSQHELNFAIVLGHALTLTQSWVYIVIFGDRLALDNGFGLSWSISTEVFFYAAYLVFFFALIRLRRVKQIGVAALGLSFLVFAFLILSEHYRFSIENFAQHHMNDHFTDWDHGVFRWFFYYSPYVRIFEFMLGCLTAQLFLQASNRPISPNERAIAAIIQALALAVLIFYGLAYELQWFGGRLQNYLDFLKLNYGPAIPIAVIVFCVSRYESTLKRLLSSTRMVLLGELSYSIYAVHTWTLRIFERPQQDYSAVVAWEAVYRIALAVVLTIIVSSATYRLIEVPSRQALRRVAAARLIRLFGPRDANMLPVEGVDDGGARAMVLVVAAIAGLVLLLVYQFAVVPLYSPYTN